MLKITIPGFGEITLNHLVLDYNGTIAVDGNFIKEISPMLTAIAKHLQIHVVTGDAFGTAQEQLKEEPCQVTILPAEQQGIAKAHFLQALNPHAVVAIGNGRNDQYMLKAAHVGIAVIGDEGVAAETLLAADVVSPSIFHALGLLQYPRRLVATLRS